MKKLGLIFCLSLLVSYAGVAQNITGSWNGSLTVPAATLTIVLHIDSSANGLTATMDSPDQGATGIPVSKIDFTDSKLRLEVGGGAITYSGTLQNDSLIAGVFKQNGISIPLTLHKGDVPKPLRPQTPQKPFPYQVDSVTFENPTAGIQLAGTLTLPPGKGPFPAVVLISGSGPQNRNEELFEHQPFWVIADYLSRRGIAVLRYDDRGTAASEGDFSSATTADFATDAAAAVAYLTNHQQIDPEQIGLIGHSEGGIIAPMVAAQDASIAFIILLAAPGENGAQLLLMQNKALATASGADSASVARLTAANKKVFDIILHTADTQARNEALKQQFASNLPAQMGEKAREDYIAEKIATLTNPWMLYFLQNDPAQYLKETACPVLAIGGSNDLQVPATENLNAIAAALKSGGNPNVTTKEFPELNHLFQTSTTGLPSEYGAIEETFAPEVLEYLTDWIDRQTSR